MSNHDQCIFNCGATDCDAPERTALDEYVYGKTKNHNFEIIVDGKKLKYPLLRLVSSWLLMVLLGYILST